MNAYAVPYPIKWNDIPESWKTNIPAQPFCEFYEVIIKPIIMDRDLPMPPEEQIRPEFIKAVEKSERDYREGRFKTFESTDKMFEYLNRDRSNE